jgi:OST3 / OST6 family, transporter family
MNVSSKIKKRSSSVSFSLSRWFSKISTTTPSSLIIALAGILYTIFIFGGGLFTIITRPPPSAYVQNTFYFLYPSLNSQFVSDTIITVILYGLGFVGLFMIYNSTKSAYNPRQAYMMLVIGVAFLLMSYIFLEGAIAFKTRGG